MTLEVLVAEIQNDPLTRDYASMTDQEVADSLNTVNRDRNRASMTGDEVFQQIANQAAWDGLTDAQRQLFMAFCGRSEIDPFAAANVNFITSIFGGGSATVTNLAAARVEQISRGVEIGFGVVNVRDVTRARLAIAGG